MNSKENLKEKAKKLPSRPGVYLFKDKKDKVLYVGKALNLRSRVLSYFNLRPLPKTAKMLGQAEKLSHILVDSEFEALLLEARLIRKYTPFYNWTAKDDKSPIYIKLGKGKLPRLSLVRKTALKKGDLVFGPFPSVFQTRRLLHLVRRAIPFCTQTRPPVKPCFHSHLGLCHPCPGFIHSLESPDKEEATRLYRKNISSLKRLLRGQSHHLLSDLREKMLSLSQKQEFEKAAQLRDQLASLENLLSPRQKITDYLKNPSLIEDIRTQEEQELLALLKSVGLLAPAVGSLKRIEGFDISRTGENLVVGSLVSFYQGEPDKSVYRRFRIRDKNARDDTAFLKEVLTRRLKRKDWPLPDLVLLDGGKPQVGAITTLFGQKGVSLPLLGLAKREETLVWYKTTFHQKKLSPHHPALKLLQRVRDESHRFANQYQKKLRSEFIKSV